MTRAVPLLLLLLAAGGCAGTASRPFDPVRDVQYSAIGSEPFWTMSIGAERIVLALGADRSRGGDGLARFDFPRVLPRTVDGVRRWETEANGRNLVVESRSGPCRNGGRGGLAFEDEVRILFDGLTLTGCGGRQLTGRRA